MGQWLAEELAFAECVPKWRLQLTSRRFFCAYLVDQSIACASMQYSSAADSEDFHCGDSRLSIRELQSSI